MGFEMWANYLKIVKLGNFWYKFTPKGKSWVHRKTWIQVYNWKPRRVQ